MTADSEVDILSALAGAEVLKLGVIGGSEIVGCAGLVMGDRRARAVSEPLVMHKTNVGIEFAESILEASRNCGLSS
jgi:hypothetical protein